MRTWMAVGMLLLAPLCGYKVVRAASAGSYPTAETDVVQAASCTAPVPPPRVRPRSEDFDRFGRQLTEYRHCVEQYVHERTVAMKHYNALALANVDAANAAVRQLNDFMTKLNEKQ